MFFPMDHGEPCDFFQLITEDAASFFSMDHGGPCEFFFFFSGSRRALRRFFFFFLQKWITEGLAMFF